MPANPETPVVEMELVTEEIPAPPVGVVNAIVVRQEKEFKDPELPVQVVDDKSPVFKWVFSWEGWEEKRGVQTGDVVVWIDLKKNEINDAWASTGDKITHNGTSYVNVN